MKDVLTVIATRGLIFERTIQSLKKNGITDYLTSVKPIPDAQNDLVRRALQEYTTYVFFVEDDMEIPEGILESMKKKDAAICCVDYPMDNGYSTICKKGEEILWCGLGCTLIKRGVLTALQDPWFDTSYSWAIRSESPLELEKINNPYKYGGLDINFCIEARKRGFTIQQVSGEAKHLRCDAIDKGKYNTGVYPIRELEAVTKRQIY